MHHTECIYGAGLYEARITSYLFERIFKNAQGSMEFWFVNICTYTQSALNTLIFDKPKSLQQLAVRLDIDFRMVIYIKP